jgi:hypothetical protein
VGHVFGALRSFGRCSVTLRQSKAKQNEGVDIQTCPDLPLYDQGMSIKGPVPTPAHAAISGSPLGRLSLTEWAEANPLIKPKTVAKLDEQDWMPGMVWSRQDFKDLGFTLGEIVLIEEAEEKRRLRRRLGELGRGRRDWDGATLAEFVLLSMYVFEATSPTMQFDPDHCPSHSSASTVQLSLLSTRRECQTQPAWRNEPRAAPSVTLKTASQMPSILLMRSRRMKAFIWPKTSSIGV